MDRLSFTGEQFLSVRLKRKVFLFHRPRQATLANAYFKDEPAPFCSHATKHGASPPTWRSASATLEASPEAVSDDAEHQKDGNQEESQRREHRSYPAEMSFHMVGNGSLPPNLGGDTPSKISRTAFGLILAAPVIGGFGAPGLCVSCSKTRREANLKRFDLQRLLFALRPERALRARRGSYSRAHGHANALRASQRHNQAMSHTSAIVEPSHVAYYREAGMFLELRGNDYYWFQRKH